MSSNRSRADRKAVEAVAKLIGSGEPVRAYGKGRAPFRWTVRATLAVAGFAAVFVVALATGRILIPGAMLVLFVVNSVMAPRGVAVTDSGVVVCSRSQWNGRPDEVLQRVPPGFGVHAGDGGRFLEVGGERIILARRSRQSVLAALARHHASPARAPAGWYPDPWDARALRYWDGSSWTAHVSAAVAAGAAPQYS